MKKLFWMAFAALAIVACSESNDKGEIPQKEIVLIGGTQTSQTVYADETSGKSSGIKFTATAAWHATVTEATAKSDSGESRVDWLTLDTYGASSAGDYTLQMNLKTNYTGADRVASINITSNQTTVSISVKQRGTKEDGTLPESPADSTTSYIVSSISVKNYNADGEAQGNDNYLFTYDNNMRLDKVEESLFFNDVLNVFTINMVYTDSTIAFTRSKANNGFVSNYKGNLNTQGYVVSGNYGSSNEAVPNNHFNTLSYDSTRNIKASTYTRGGFIVYSFNIFWSNGNMVQVIGEKESHQMAYSMVKNSTNIDLNWFLCNRLGYFSWSLAEPYFRIASILGYTGSRSEMMLSGTNTVYEGEGWLVKSQAEKIEYETGENQQIVKIKQTSYSDDVIVGSREIEITYQ